MCGTYTKEAADHALRSPWDPQSLRPFTMTVKGKWTDVPALPPLPYNNFSREGVHLPSPMV